MESRSGNEGIPYSIREDFAIDRDPRAILFDAWLLSNGFKYLGTLMSNPDFSAFKIGGTRQYESNSLYIGIAHQNINIELSWYIDKPSNHRELAHGVGLPLMVLAVNKYKG